MMNLRNTKYAGKKLCFSFGVVELDEFGVFSVEDDHKAREIAELEGFELVAEHPVVNEAISEQSRVNELDRLRAEFEAAYQLDMAESEETEDPAEITPAPKETPAKPKRTPKK